MATKIIKINTFCFPGDKCALMLLKSGAGPNKATEDGQTPVHVAAKYGNLATLVLLLEDGGDPLRKTKVKEVFLFKEGTK